MTGTGQRAKDPAGRTGSASRLRIKFVTVGYPPDDVGGAERQAQRQATELVGRGHEVTVVTAQVQKHAKSGPVDGIAVTRLRRPQWPILGTLLYCFNLTWYLVRTRRQYDIVHVHLANLQLDAAAIASAITRAPLYAKVAAGGRVGEVQRFSRVAVVTRRVGLRWADRVQAISQEIADELAAASVRAERIVRIPNGIDLQAFGTVDEAERRQLRRELKLDTERLIVLFLGRLATYKGLDDLMNAWSEHGLAHEALLLVVGPQAVDHPAGLLTSQPGVEIRGASAQPQDYLHACDVFVLPSHAEGMSNALLEAMACGRPAIATNVGASAEMLDHGRAGLVVPPQSPAELASSLKRLLLDGELRDALGGAARERSKTYSIERVVDSIEQEYFRLLSEHPRRGIRRLDQRLAVDAGPHAPNRRRS
jgi:glycosyltransferase involved in cell wall biosynthesis